MRKDKIYFVNRFFYPDISATSQILTDLLKALSADTNELSVITSNQIYDDSKANLKSFEIYNNIVIHRIFSTQYGRASFGRAIDYISFYISLLVFLFNKVGKNDLVVAKTDPPMVSIIVKFVSIIKGFRQINWLQDVFPEIVEYKSSKIFSVILVVIKYVRDWSLRNCMNIVISNAMKNVLMERSIEKKNIKVIHNWSVAPSNKVINKENNSLVKAWGLENKFVIGYSGNLGQVHDYFTIVGAIRILKDIEDIRFIFIGGGVNIKEIKKIIDDEKIRCVEFYPYQSIDLLEESLAVPDIHLVTLLDEMEGLVMPSKIYGILSSGRAVINIGMKNGEIATMIENYCCGRTVSIGDSKSLANEILAFKDDSNKLKEYSYNSRTYYEKFHEPENSYDLWRNVLHSAR